MLEKLLPQTGQHITKIDTPEFFGLIEEYVKDKLNEPLSLQQACMHIGISQTYMSRLFRKYTGLSFSNYLTRSRIELAKQYLSDGKTLIKDAATMAGFKDQFYFSKVFKSFTGFSPSDYISNTTYTQKKTQVSGQNQNNAL
jgi:two-component system response regulator YesN